MNLADEAILIGTGPARDSYLLSARIISVSEQSQADAIHPGYGFLSENADFAELVTNSGFTWIGLKSATIRSMGDKNRAHKFAEKARIQILPGNERLDKIDLGYIEELASKIRLPLIVKASAGGGGIGMKQVNDNAKFCQHCFFHSENGAKNIGDPTIYLEKFVPFFSTY